MVLNWCKLFICRLEIVLCINILFLLTFWMSDSVKRQTYQIQHRFYNIPVADLSHLDQAGKNREFHFDIPDWNRWIHNPRREDHWTRAARHHRLGGGSSGDCSSVLPMTRSGLSVRESHIDRHRHRCLAWHFQGKRTASGVPSKPARNSVNALKRLKQRKTEYSGKTRQGGKNTQEDKIVF